MDEHLNSTEDPVPLMLSTTDSTTFPVSSFGELPVSSSTQASVQVRLVPQMNVLIPKAFPGKFYYPPCKCELLNQIRYFNPKNNEFYYHSARTLSPSTDIVSGPKTITDNPSSLLSPNPLETGDLVPVKFGPPFFTGGELEFYSKLDTSDIAASGGGTSFAQNSQYLGHYQAPQFGMPQGPYLPYAFPSSIGSTMNNVTSGSQPFEFYSLDESGVCEVVLVIMALLLWLYSFYRLYLVWQKTLNFSEASIQGPQGWDLLVNWIIERIQIRKIIDPVINNTRRRMTCVPTASAFPDDVSRMEEGASNLDLEMPVVVKMEPTVGRGGATPKNHRSRTSASPAPPSPVIIIDPTFKNVTSDLNHASLVATISAPNSVYHQHHHHHLEESARRPMTPPVPRPPLAVQGHPQVQLPRGLVQFHGSGGIRAAASSTGALSSLQTGSGAMAVHGGQGPLPAGACGGASSPGPLEDYRSLGGAARRSYLQKQMSEDVSRNRGARMNRSSYLNFGNMRSLRSFRSTSYESDVMPSCSSRPWSGAKAAHGVDDSSPLGNLSFVSNAFTDSIVSIQEIVPEEKSSSCSEPGGDGESPSDLQVEVVAKDTGDKA